MKNISSGPQIPNLDKVGNLIIYLVDQIEEKYRQKVYLTKLLKLIYIIDELSVKSTGAPVTGLEYRVWKMGPVAFEVYADLMHNNSDKLGTFAETKKKTGDIIEKGSALVKSTNVFDDSEFSDYEMELIDSVIEEHGHKQSDDLINLLHEPGSLWKKVVDDNQLESKFSQDNTSDLQIDFTELIKGDKQKMQVFQTAKDSLKI